MKVIWHFVIFSFSIALSAASGAASPGIANSASVLSHRIFESAGTRHSLSQTASLRALRSRSVRINPSWVVASENRPNDFGLNSVHQFELFPDVTISVVITDSTLIEKGRFVIFGRVEGAPESSVILAFNRGFVNGTFLVPGGASYQIASGPAGVHTILKLDPAKSFDCDVK